MNWALAILSVWALGWGASGPGLPEAQGAEFGTVAVPITRSQDPAARIDALALEPLAGLREKEREVYVVFRGGVRRPGALSVQGAVVTPNSKGLFVVGIPRPDLKPGEKQAPVTWEFREGARVIREVLWIELAPQASEAKESREPKQDFWSMALQATSISYTETSQTPYTAYAVTGKLNFIHRFKDSPWEIGGSAYGTIYPFAKSRPEEGRFLGVNARAGARLPFVKSPWSFRLLAGAYYTRMFVTNMEFGFQDMWGPQLFPVIAYATSPRNAISVYGKYSPVTLAGTVNFGSYELAFGGAFTSVLGPKTRLDLLLDVAFMSVAFESRTASVQTISFGVGYGF